MDVLRPYPTTSDFLIVGVPAGPFLIVWRSETASRRPALQHLLAAGEMLELRFRERSKE
jgi:hypothetical protein